MKLINLEVLNKHISETREIGMFYIRYILNKLNKLVSKKEVVELINKNKLTSRYPKARWARRGFIDLTNCKDIDYIIVPCTTKQQCLYVTNQYLKDQIHVETLESIYGLELEVDDNGYVIFPEDFTKKVGRYFDYDLSPITEGGGSIHPRVLTDLDLSELPANSKSSHFINCKEFCKMSGVTPASGGKRVPTLCHTIKDCHNGFKQFLYFKDSHMENYPYDKLGKVSLLFTPYMVFGNPFRGTLGGVIPVKDGKLLIDKAIRLKNKTLELVSTGELIRFDGDGVCTTQLNPNTYIYTTLYLPRLTKYWTSNNVDSSDRLTHRRGSSSFRSRVRYDSGMMYLKKSNGKWNLKHLNLWAYTVDKRKYKRFRDYGSFGDGSFLSHQTSHDNHCVLSCKHYKDTVYIAPYDRMNTYTINKYAFIKKLYL